LAAREREAEERRLSALVVDAAMRVWAMTAPPDDHDFAFDDACSQLAAFRKRETK